MSSQNQGPNQGSIVSASTVTAAGLASAAASMVTSSFGVAGTILGAALTTMIITGGSAILRAYLESATGKVRTVPNKLRARAGRSKADGAAEPETMPGRPDLRDNFAGRMRAALGWFSHLSPLARRSILIKGLIAAAIAFVIGMGVVYAMERGIIGNSLSCGLWGKCPEGATPGINGGKTGTGASSTLSLGRAKTDAARQEDETLNTPARQQDPGEQQDVQPAPSDRGSDAVDSGEPGPLQRLQDLAEPAPKREPDSEQQDLVQQRPSPNQQTPGQQDPGNQQDPGGQQPTPERPGPERPDPERPDPEEPPLEEPPPEEPPLEEPDPEEPPLEEPPPEDQ